MRIALIFNPMSGRGRPKAQQLPRVVEALAGAGMEVSSFPTEGPGHATEVARCAARQRYQRVVVWGGDGTLNEVAGGLVGTETVLGIIPGGTVNVFARETGIPRSLDGAVENLVRGRVVRIPVGIANGRPFLEMAGVGLDGEVVYRLKSSFKDALGVFAFWIDGFRALARYPMPPIRVHSGGRKIQGSGLVAGKLRRYGPSHFITPEARLEEPELHVVVFKGRKRRNYLRYLAGVVFGVHLRFRDVENFKSDEIVVESDGRVAYQLDGEPAGFAPVTLEVKRDALSVILPPGIP